MFGKALNEFLASLVKRGLVEHMRGIQRKRLNGVAYLVWFGWYDVLRRY